MAVSDYHDFINRDLPIRLRACESKAAYVTRGEARNRVRNGRSMDGSVRPYRCRFCTLWHLGHRRHRHPSHR